MRKIEAIRTGVFLDATYHVGEQNAHVSYEEIAAALRKLAVLLMGKREDAGVLVRMAADEVEQFRKTLGWDQD
jgi:hypothetical protein